MLVPFTAQAGDPSPDVNEQLTAMQVQIDTLNKRLGRLEQMLQSLQPPPDTATGSRTTNTDETPPPPVTSIPAAISTPALPGLAAYRELEVLRTNWKQLQRGLSRTELRQLLGKPQSEMVLDQQTLWYYRYPGIGGGSVMLDSKGEVTGWQEPPFRNW